MKQEEGSPDVPAAALFSKVPQVTIFFWIIKVLCTTVGETASDFLNVDLGWGLKGTAVAAGIALAAVLVFQFRANKYMPWIYWLAVVLISVFGTLVTDILTDSLGFPLEASTIIFAAALAATFGIWYANEKTLSIHSIFTTRREAFYWLAILFTFALGTAAGDLMAEKLGLGYPVTGLIVVGVIAAASMAWRLGLDAVLAFWIAYILTRPLGASLGDYLSQSRENGGLGLGATVTSAGFLLAILGVVIYLAATKRDFLANPLAEEMDVPKGHSVIWQVVAVVLILTVGGVAGYYARRSQLQRQAASSVTREAPLGDVSKFRGIGEDMLTKARAGDIAGAKTRADDLETAWDNSQAVMQPMDPAKWTLMDSAIDEVLSTTRGGRGTDSVNALEKFIVIIDTLGDPPSPATAQPEETPQPEPSAPIGDLAPFRKIADEMVQLAARGDAAGTKAKAGELETKWDAAQPKMQAANTAKWHQIDAAIDDVLKKARSGQPAGAETQASLKVLIAKIDAMAR